MQQVIDGMKVKSKHFQALKFVQIIQLSSVRRLVDVLDVEECDESGEVLGNFSNTTPIKICHHFVMIKSLF